MTRLISLILVFSLCLMLFGCTPVTIPPEETTAADPSITIDYPPTPTGLSPLPNAYTAEDLVSAYEEHLQWTDSLDREWDCIYRIPQILPFSEDAARCQAEINEDFFHLLEQEIKCYQDGFSPWCVGLDYQVYLYEDILSVVICTDLGYAKGYDVYCFDLENGWLMDTGDFLAKKDINRQDYNQSLYQFAQATFLEMSGPKEDAPDPEFYQQQMDKTLSNENLANAKLYTDNDGTVRILLQIYALAGEDSYGHLLKFPMELIEERILNWSIPDYPKLSYEEYFSEIRNYPYNERGEFLEYGYYRSTWHTSDGYCEIWLQDSKIFAGSSLSGHYVQVGEETYSEDTTFIVGCDEQWIYVIEDNTTLFRMDYRGENRQVLFVDETGKIATYGFSTTVYVRDGSVLFFMAGAGDDYGFYRLYLHDMTLDLLYTTPIKSYLLAPYSNQEITWYCDNPEFEALYDKLMSDPTSKYSQMDPDGNSAKLEISSDYKTPIEYDYYYNAKTGKLLEQPLYGERSWGNANWAWWLED